MQGWHNKSKSRNIIQNTNIIKDKNHIRISIDAEKSFDKIHPFMIKALKKLRVHGTFLNIIKAIHDKPIANILLNVEKLKTFLLKSGMRQQYPLLLLLFCVIPDRSQRNDMGERNQRDSNRESNQITLTCR
jgi:hypothetical protein